MVIECGEGERHANVYFSQRRQTEAVLHSCSEVLWKSFPQANPRVLARSRKHDALQRWEHRQKRGDFFQTLVLTIFEVDLQDSDIICDPRRLSKISEQIRWSEAVGDIAKSSADDDMMEPISLGDLREDWMGLRACEEGFWMRFEKAENVIDDIERECGQRC